MSYRKFGKNDITINTLRSYPKVSFYIYNGEIYYNNIGIQTGEFRIHPNNVYMTDTGYENLYEYNIDRVAQGFLGGPGTNQLIYPYVPKDGSRTSLYLDGPISKGDYASKGYGELFTGSYPQYASIKREFLTSPSGSCDTLDKADCGHNFSFFSLKNYLNHYSTLSPHYAVTSSLGEGWDKNEQKLNIIHIPSIFYGTKIRPGTVKLRFYVTGSLIGELSDEKENGELIQTMPTGSAYSGSVAGVVLYNEGFLVMTGSWPIEKRNAFHYEGTGGAQRWPRWIYFGAGARDGVDVGTGEDSIASASFALTFDGVSKTQVITMDARAPRGKANYSNNPTYIGYGQRLLNMTASQIYEENDTRIIKNTVSSSFENYEESYKRQVYISKVGVYDEEKNLIGIATLANPVLKEEEQDITFRIKLDI